MSTVPTLPNSEMYDFSFSLFEKATQYISGAGDLMAQSSASKLNALQYDINSRLSASDADEAIRAGQQQSQVVNVERAKTISSQRAAFGSSGFVVGSGTTGEYLDKTDYEFRKTMSEIELQSAYNASALTLQSRNQEINAELNRKLAKVQKFQGMANAVIGIASAGLGYYAKRQSGVK